MRIVLLCALVSAAQTASAADLIGQWAFEAGAPLEDSTGNWGDLVLGGNATISGGELDVNGSGITASGWVTSQVFNPAMGSNTIGDKTLISWVSLDSLAAKAGSAMTIDATNIDRFDGIIFAETEQWKWQNGSNGGARNDPAVSVDDTVLNSLRQMAISYEDLGNGTVNITICRDGVQLGQYTSANYATWAGATAEIHFGLRHTLGGNRGALDAHLAEARIYNDHMTCGEIFAISLNQDSDNDGVNDDVDECDFDPDKSLEGFCGCDWIDLDINSDATDETCVHNTAYVDPRATLMPEARIHAGAYVAAGAVIGGGVEIGNNSVVGRRAIVNGLVRDDVVIGRAAQVLNGSVIGDGTVLGYAVMVDNSDVDDDVVIGSLVEIGDGGVIGDDVVLAKSTQLGTDADLGVGVIIGPNGIIGNSVQILTTTRIRKDVGIGDGAEIGSGVRIGRNADIGASSTLGNSARLRANVTITPGTCIADNETVLRGETAGDVCP